MGCCLGCDDPERTELLAEYNPLLLGDTVELTTAPIETTMESQTESSMYTDRLIERADKYIQGETDEPPSLSMLRIMTPSQFVAPILAKMDERDMADSII